MARCRATRIFSPLRSVTRTTGTMTMAATACVAVGAIITLFRHADVRFSAPAAARDRVRHQQEVLMRYRAIALVLSLVCLLLSPRAFADKQSKDDSDKDSKKSAPAKKSAEK